MVTFTYNSTLGWDSPTVTGIYSKTLTNGQAYSNPAITSTAVSGFSASAGNQSFSVSYDGGSDSTDYTVGINASEVFYGQTVIGCRSADPTKGVVIGANNTLHFYTTSSSSGIAGTSDKRDKSDFKSIEKSLEFINTLEPITFVDNNRDKYKDASGSFNMQAYEAGSLKGHRRIAGFIAQDVYQTLKDVYQDDNYASIVDYSKYDDPDNEVDRYYMRYTQLIPFLTGAVQELSKEIDTLKATITELKSQSINQ